ncbi:MAG: hypothetical protein ACJ738_06740 [Gaiellales bacterium]
MRPNLLDALVTHALSPVKNVVLTAAATHTRHAGSARVAMDMTMSTEQGTITMHGTGQFRLHGPAADAMHLSITVPTAGTTIAMDERILGTTIYMRSPLLSRSIPNSRPWLKLDLERIGKQQGIDFAALMNSSSSDPTQVLTYLDATSETVVNLGHERVDGVATTHYHADIDLSKAMRVMVARAPAGERKAVRSTYRNLLQQSGTTSYPVDVWVDADGYVRQMHASVPMPVAQSSMDMTMRLSHFGAPVHITPPPASQVTDLASLAARGT